MPHQRIHTALLITISLQASTALAGGFALNEQSASQLGRAFAGRASASDDASTVYGNPAGMSRLDAPQLVAGGAVIHSSSSIDVEEAAFDTSLGDIPIAGAGDGDPVPTTPVPFGYWIQPVDDRWSAGLGVYANFGLETDYADDFTGRYFGTLSEITVVTLQPSLSLQINEHWSVGGGVTYNRVEGELNRREPASLDPEDDVRVGVQGEDTSAWGFNVGVLFEPNRDSQLGLTYHSRIDVKLQGDTRLRNYPLGGTTTTLTSTSSLRITLPDLLELSYSWQPHRDWRVHGSLTRTGWSRLDQLAVDNRPPVPDATENLDWDSSWMLSLGADYQLNRQWTLRAGIAVDQSPIPDATRSVRIPSGDRQLYALGAAWQPLERLTADLAYMYIDEEAVDVEQSATTTTGVPYRFAAQYDSTIQIVALQVGYRF